MGAFAQIAERLIERGYAAVPIIPGTKRPGVLSNGQWVGLPRWQNRYNGRAPSETEISPLVRRRHWRRRARRLSAALSRWTSIPTTPPSAPRSPRSCPARRCARSASAGRRCSIYAPHVTASKRWLIDGEVICELIGPGRQTVIPPTIHPDTNAPYRWSGTEGLDAVKPARAAGAAGRHRRTDQQPRSRAFGYADEKSPSR